MNDIDVIACDADGNYATIYMVHMCVCVCAALIAPAAMNTRIKHKKKDLKLIAVDGWKLTFLIQKC